MRLRIKVESNPGFGKMTSGMASARRRALVDAAEYILSRSREIAPLRTGELIASAHAESDDHSASVRYTAPYALIQHENTRFHHPNGRRAGYLATVIDDPATLAYAEARIASALRDRLGG